MAQGTGAKRFLVPAAKAAGAGGILALVAVALLLGGCGGSSSGPEVESTGKTGADAAITASDSPTTEAVKQEGDAGAGVAGRESSGNGTVSKPATGEGREGQKRGSRIAQATGPAEQAPTPAQIASATVADMTLRSPAIIASGGSPGRLAAKYTCDGQGSWPSFTWSGVPAETAELIIYAMSVQPVEEELFVDWAVAGLDPSLEGIEEGKLPKDAIVGTNGFGKRGYSICPSSSGEIYMFAVYALTTPLSPREGFNARELRRQILDFSGNVGLLPAVYARG